MFLIQFMAWERGFEDRVLKVRDKELKFQKQIFFLEVLEFEPLRGNAD